VHDSVTVTAKATPDEAEAWKVEKKLNDAYQAIFVVEQQGDCETAIRRYESEVVPAAQSSKFAVPKNKFLFLANRGIGNCRLAQRRYEEAERKFTEIMEYLPIWPGTDDSAYPINLRQIATAQMGQQHWAAAEDSLKKSISLFDATIERRRKWDKESGGAEFAGPPIGLKATTLAYLGIVYLREGRVSDALKTSDTAWDTVMQPHVPSSFQSGVVKLGLAIAQASGDENAISEWTLRSSQQK
jgi:tetratricopeptide (TPR) repeat protein